MVKHWRVQTESCTNKLWQCTNIAGNLVCDYILNGWPWEFNEEGDELSRQGEIDDYILCSHPRFIIRHPRYPLPAFSIIPVKDV